MSNKHRFLISYILEGQPMTIDVEHDNDELSQKEAIDYIRRENQVSTESAITDVQIASDHGPTREPSHNLQP